MAKLKTPLLSLGASGTLSRAITFLRRRHQNIAEKKPELIDAQSEPQLSWRTMFEACTLLWHTLSAADKNEWERLATPKHMTGYALWQSQCLRPNPGIYLPLAGGHMTGNITMEPSLTLDGIDLSAHAADTTTAHGAVSAATASKIVIRDAEGQAAFAAPAAAGDALIKGTALTITEMAALTTGKVWLGAANRPTEATPSIAPTSGQYTGNSTANRAIAHGLGFAPKLVIIAAINGYTLAIIIMGKIGRIETGANAYAVTAPTTTNFYVGNATSYSLSANLDTVVYDWVAIG